MVLVVIILFLDNEISSNHLSKIAGVFDIITDRPVFQDVMVTEHHLGSVKSNKTFAIDANTQGTPVKLQLKITNVLNDEPEEINLI